MRTYAELARKVMMYTNWDSEREEYFLQSGVPDIISDLFYDIIGDDSIDRFSKECVIRALDEIEYSTRAMEIGEDPRDAVDEGFEVTDIYYRELSEWLIGNQDRVNETITEMGWDPKLGGIYHYIRAAQARLSWEILDSTIRWLDANAEGLVGLMEIPEEKA
jgi:hypothetical protein